MFLQELRDLVLLNYHLVLFLLKPRDVWVFWNKKKSGPNRGNPLNSSIDKGQKMRRKKKAKTLGLLVLFYSKKKLVSLFFIYNFYFENLIYKLIKQFKYQQESDPIWPKKLSLFFIYNFYFENLIYKWIK